MKLTDKEKAVEILKLVDQLNEKISELPHNYLIDESIENRYTMGDAGYRPKFQITISERVSKYD